MSKKGFTLIELLAVIVILAIIALIATPIVLNIINDTKESAVLRSADFYIAAVENEIMLENMKQGGSFNPNTCEITNGAVSCDDKEITLKVDGEVPSNGSITFEDGKVTSISLTYTNGTVTLNNKGELILGESKEPEEKSICKLVENGDVAPAGISVGDKYQCKVKDNMETGFEDGYYFFVLGTNSDGTTNLIMERNIYYDSTNDVGLVATETNTGLVAWYSPSQSNSFGPVTAMDYLYNATKDWSNVPNIVMNYTDEGNTGSYGYGTITTTNNITKIAKKDTTAVTVLTDKEGYTNLKARMPMYSEVTGEGKCTTSSGSCPLYLANYLNSSSYVTGDGLQNISKIYGYWTLPSDAANSGYAWYVSYNGYVSDYIVNNGSYRGVRPVITLEI